MMLSPSSRPFFSASSSAWRKRPHQASDPNLGPGGTVSRWPRCFHPPASNTSAPWKCFAFMAASSPEMASLSVLPLSHHHQQFTPYLSDGSANSEADSVAGAPAGPVDAAEAASTRNPAATAARKAAQVGAFSMSSTLSSLSPCFRFRLQSVNRRTRRALWSWRQAGRRSSRRQARTRLWAFPCHRLRREGASPRCSTRRWRPYRQPP